MKTIAKTFCEDHNLPDRERVLDVMIESYVKEREDILKGNIIELLEFASVDKKKMDMLVDFIKRI